MAKFLGQPKPVRCSACGEFCELFMPDNRTFVPCCPDCWEQIDTVDRMKIIMAGRQEATWDALVQIVNGWLDEKVAEIVRQKLNDRQTWGDN